jgi:hypothetical protein
VAVVTDHQIFVVAQACLDRIEQLALVARMLVYLSLAFLAVTAVSVADRRRLAPLPVIFRLVLVFERPTLAVWRGVGKLSRWIVGPSMRRA